MTTVILRTLQSEDKTAPLKLTIPEAWAGAPCAKLIKAWSKRKQCTGEVYLASNDGTPIPNDWPWEAAVELYGCTLRVGERRDAADDVAKRCDDDVATNARASALLRRGAREAEHAFRRVLEGGAAALGDASEAAGDAATAASEGLDSTTACAADVATARRELLRADGTDDAAEVTRRLERALAAARVAKQTAPESAEIKKLEAAALCRLKRWPEAAAALGGDEMDAPKGAVPQTVDRRDALDLLKAICYGGDAARAARVASAWAAQFYKSRDWCASQARRYKSVAELKDKGDAAFRAGDARAAERWYAAALDEDPEHPALHYNSAACLEKLGRPLDAAQRRASALRCRPDYQPARRARAASRAGPPPTATAGRTPRPTSRRRWTSTRGARTRPRAGGRAEAPPLQHGGPRGRRRGGARLRGPRPRATSAAAPPAEGRGPDVVRRRRRAARRVSINAQARVPRAGAAHAPGQEQGARRRGPLPGAAGGLRRAVGRAGAGGVRPGDVCCCVSFLFSNSNPSPESVPLCIEFYMNGS